MTNLTNKQDDIPEDCKVTCDCCNGTFDRDMEDLTNVDGDIYCEDCACSELVWIDRQDRYIPTDQAMTCDDCGDAFEYMHECYITDQHNNTICEFCSENYAYCQDTNDHRHQEDCYFDDYGEAYSECPDHQGPLYSYDTDPLTICGNDGLIKGVKRSMYRNKALMFGVELETDGRDCDAEDMADTLNRYDSLNDHAICKTDATCSGIELVTIPADLFSHKNTIQWAKWCDTLRPIAKGFYGRDNGIHVHINLQAIRPLTLGKMLVFMNALKNRDLLGTIAQREYWNSEWCQTKPEDFDTVGKAGIHPRAGKYSAANVTMRTVEIRIFKANLLPERIIKNVEFCHALVKFCNATSVKKLSSDDFLKYVTDNRKTYDNLYSFLNNRSEA